MSAANRWMHWEPKGQIFSKSPSREPTKPSKPGSVGFVGADQADIQKIEERSMGAEHHLEPEDGALTRGQTEALRLLNLAGVRIIRRGSDLQIGVWEELDGVEIRQALRTVGLDAHPVVHLESPGIDFRYKVRRTPDRAPGESFTAWLKRAEQALPAVVAAYRQR